ncbi:unnamed protein product [Ixodes hexagonus]
MAALSKLFETSFPFYCYEIAHPWEPSCTASWVAMFADTFTNSFKLYSLLYLLGQLVGRKATARAFAETLLNTVRSASFLSYNVMLFMFFICFLRQVAEGTWSVGKLYLQNSTFIAGLASGFFSIFLEHPSRHRCRNVLALTNCGECLGAQNFVTGSHMVCICPHGVTCLAAQNIAAMLCNVTTMLDNRLRDPVCKVLRLLMGKEEFLPAPDTDSSDRNNLPCHHEGSCLEHAAKGSALPFLGGYSVRALLLLLGRRLRRRPWLALTRWAPWGQGLFLGGAVALFRGSRCLLRRAYGQESPWHVLVGGLLAGLSMAASPNSTLALYMAWKLVEVLYCWAAKEGYAPVVPLGPEMLFALGTGVMMFCAVVEPHNMRQSYAKFLNDISGDRLRQVNRHPLEILGFHCSSIYPDYFPNLDQRHVSRTFVERVLVWS